MIEKNIKKTVEFWKTAKDSLELSRTQKRMYSVLYELAVESDYGKRECLVTYLGIDEYILTLNEGLPEELSSYAPGQIVSFLFGDTFGGKISWNLTEHYFQYIPEKTVKKLTDLGKKYLGKRPEKPKKKRQKRSILPSGILFASGCVGSAAQNCDKKED